MKTLRLTDNLTIEIIVVEPYIIRERDTLIFEVEENGGWWQGYRTPEGTEIGFWTDDEEVQAMGTAILGSAIFGGILILFLGGLTLFGVWVDRDEEEDE